MKKYQKSRVRMTVKIILSLLLPLLAFLSVPVLAGERLSFESRTLYFIALAVAYPVIIFTFMRRYIVYAYRNSITMDEDGFHCENMYVRGALVNADIKYADIESVELFSPGIPMGAFALRVRVKGEKLPVDIDNRYRDWPELWQTVCGKCRESDPGIFIDRHITERIKKGECKK